MQAGILKTSEMFNRLRISASLVAVFWAAAGAGAVLAQTNPASLPAHDAHDGLLVAADPLTEVATYKSRFGKKNPYEAGIMAIEVFFRNDNERPIRLNLESIRLLLAAPGADRQRFGPLAVEDVVDRVLNKGGPNPTTPRTPIPIPGRSSKIGHGKEWNELAANLRAVTFETDLLPPRSTVHGFLFFDMNHHYDLVSYARLYIPDLKFMEDSKPLLYFEVDLSGARPH